MEPVRSDTTNKVGLELENEKGYVLLSPLVVVDKMHLIVIVSLGWVTSFSRFFTGIVDNALWVTLQD